jgi:hypothetical protein
MMVSVLLRAVAVANDGKQSLAVAGSDMKADPSESRTPCLLSLAALISFFAAHCVMIVRDFTA